MISEWNRGLSWSQSAFRVCDFMARSLPSPTTPSQGTEPAFEIYLDSPTVSVPTGLFPAETTQFPVAWWSGVLSCSNSQTVHSLRNSWCLGDRVYVSSNAVAPTASTEHSSNTFLYNFLKSLNEKRMSSCIGSEKPRMRQVK